MAAQALRRAAAGALRAAGGGAALAVYTAAATGLPQVLGSAIGGFVMEAFGFGAFYASFALLPLVSAVALPARTSSVLKPSLVDRNTALDDVSREAGRVVFGLDDDRLDTEVDVVPEAKELGLRLENVLRSIANFERDVNVAVGARIPVGPGPIQPGASDRSGTCIDQPSATPRSTVRRVPQGLLGQDFQNTFGEYLVYLSMARDRLRHASLRVAVPVMFCSVPNLQAAGRLELTNEIESFQPTSSSATWRASGI